MGKRLGESTKKAEGQARKAAQAQAKTDAKTREQEAVEAQKWNQGAKSTAKADATAAKAEEAARKREEKKALLAEEEASTPGKGGKKPAKQTRGKLDLSGLDDPKTKAKTLNATGIDNALDALSLDSKNDKVDRHPERRFKAAYAQYEERRLEELKSEKGLRRNQKLDMIRKEFDKHPDNPFNQVHAQYNSTGNELNQIKTQQREDTEKRLASA